MFHRAGMPERPLHCILLQEGPEANVHTPWHGKSPTSIAGTVVYIIANLPGKTHVRGVAGWPFPWRGSGSVLGSVGASSMWHKHPWHCCLPPARMPGTAPTPSTHPSLPAAGPAA